MYGRATKVSRAMPNSDEVTVNKTHVALLGMLAASSDFEGSVEDLYMPRSDL